MGEDERAVLVAGATGVVGRHLVPRLVERGHRVWALARSGPSASAVESMGAIPIEADALDRGAVLAAAEQARPHAIVNQLTAIPSEGLDPRRIGKAMAATNRLRREATRNLVEAAERVGAERVVAQSIAFAYEPAGLWVVNEDHPLHVDARGGWGEVVGAVAALEEAVLGGAFTGIVLRYGWFYGPGTAIAPDGPLGQMARSRRLPVIGNGKGMQSFCHPEDAADAAVVAIGRGEGVYNVCDDEPAQARVWVPALAEALGAPPPRRVPSWVARPLAGRVGVDQMTRQRGASNRRARTELGWEPSRPSWREGFRELLA